MNLYRCWIVLRSAAPVIVGFCVAPMSCASTIATTQQQLTAVHAGMPAFQIVGEAGSDRERIRQVELLAAADSRDISRSLLARFPQTPVQASRADLVEMGLQLPEPGPLSAIIATLALAGFVMVRRVV